MPHQFGWIIHVIINICSGAPSVWPDDMCYREHPISVCRLRERGHMSKSVYVCVVHDLESLSYVLRCAIE